MKYFSTFLYSMVLFGITSCNSSTNNSDNCTVYISNPLVVLYEEPRHFSQEIISVPSDSYEVIQSEEVEWVNFKQRWLKIRVGKREGWIKDDTWTIDKKSDACK